jgi:hypothetical protein
MRYYSLIFSLLSLQISSYETGYFSDTDSLIDSIFEKGINTFSSPKMC